MNERIKQIQENPFKTFIILSLPIIFLLFFNESYVILDTYYLSHLGNSVVVAFGYVANMYYFINRSGKGIGKGVSSMIARLIGAKEFENVNNIALHGIILIIIITILFQIIFALFGNAIIGLFVLGEENSLIYIYLQCLAFFLLFICLSEYLVEILNGEGNTRLSTIIMSIGVVLNIILDYIFIFPCNLGFLGASLGTALAYVGTTAIFLYSYLIKNNHIVKFKLSDFNFDLAIIREILVNAIPIILDSLLVTLSGLILMHSLKTFAPEITVVAFIILFRIQTFLSAPITGLSRACNIVVGHLFGAKRFKNVMKQLNKSIYASFLINGLISAILIIFLNIILAYFTNQADVISEVRNILGAVIIDLIIISTIFNCNQSLVAIGRSVNSFYSVIIKLILLSTFIFISCHLFGFGKFGVLISLILSDLIQAFYSYITFKSFISKEETNLTN